MAGARKILAVATKEFKQIRRDPLTLAMLLGLPAMMLLLYGYAINFDVRHVRLAIEDRSRSAASRDLAATFVNSTYFDLVADLPAGAARSEIFERRQAQAILVIPEPFADELAAGRTAPVQLLLDGTDASTATTVLGYANGLVADVNVRLVGIGPQGAPIRYEPRVWYNPELESTQFLVPGLMGFILMLTAVLSTAMSIVRERERGTMEQLRVTALRPIELVLGKTVPYLLISLAATAIIVLAADVLFDVKVRGSYLDLFIATLLYLVGALAFGLLVSTVARSQAMAFQVGLLLSLLPSIFLSGFIFPLRSMPLPLRVISYAVPARYYLNVARAVIIKGAGLAPFARDLAFLAVFALVVMALSFARLTRREA